MQKEAYITMVTSKDYIVGAIVMAHSLRSTGSIKSILCLVTSNDLDDRDLESLSSAGLLPVKVDPIPAPSSSGIKEWDNVGYTKINIWSLCEWDVLVYIDADCLVLECMDGLFERYNVNISTTTTI